MAVYDSIVLRDALQQRPLPAVVVDLQAFDANVALLRGAVRRERLTLRVATKSIRVPALLKRVQEQGGPIFRGWMTFAADETAALAAEGFDDFLLGYPVASAREARVLAELAASGRTVRVVVDHVDHLPLLGAAAQSLGVTLAVCIDVDMSTRLPGIGHVGVRRSPLQTPAAVVALAQAIAGTPGLRVDALLGYEAQVAGLADHQPRQQPWLDPIRRRVKQRSMLEVMQRRQRTVAALADAGFALSLVNGGGTGSVHATGMDGSVTEITVGSGLVTPTLFDHYDALALQPALFFVLPVVRIPGPGFVTCAGGGYIASGPPGLDRTPMVAFPTGLTPLDLEGWGEVQTPFSVAAGATTPRIGDLVWCRPAKAGELAERFASYQLVHADGRVESAPTYRGLGSTWT
jgi:D-serine deaminase-like pyridoxal phosphate-dependent protein